MAGTGTAGHGPAPVVGRSGAASPFQEQGFYQNVCSSKLNCDHDRPFGDVLLCSGSLQTWVSVLFFGAFLAALSVLRPGAVPAAAALGVPDWNGNFWLEGWLRCGHEPEASRKKVVAGIVAQQAQPRADTDPGFSRESFTACAGRVWTVTPKWQRSSWPTQISSVTGEMWLP